MAAAESAMSGVVLRALVRGIWVALVLGRLVEPRLQRAVANLDATYEFRADAASRQLTFSGGAVRVEGSGGGGPPDFTIVFIDMRRALRHMLRHPNDTLALLAENMVEHRGNTHYLFRLGYLLGLCQSRADAVRGRARSAVQKLKR